MALEIERKFLVTDSFKQFVSKQEEIVQGYLSSSPGCSVRVRIKGEKAYITVKGKGNESGTSRYEWEKEISVEDAHELMLLCDPKGIIDKIRYFIISGNHTFEVDEFRGDNEGLVVAEIELSDENEEFEKPQWLGKEVTGEARYYNSSLSKKPYSKWKL